MAKEDWKINGSANAYIEDVSHLPLPCAVVFGTIRRFPSFVRLSSCCTGTIRRALTVLTVLEVCWLAGRLVDTRALRLAGRRVRTEAGRFDVSSMSLSLSSLSSAVSLTRLASVYSRSELHLTGHAMD